MDIRSLAIKLIEQSEVEVYSMLHILKEMSTDEARAKIRSREQKFATQVAWKRANAQFKQVYKTYRSKFTRHK